MVERKAQQFFPGGPARIGDVLKGFLEKNNMLERVEIFQHIRMYPHFFPETAAFSKAVDYKGSTLFLEVSDPMYSLEARKMIPRIIRVFQQKGLPVEKVKIRCRQTR